MSDIPKSKRAYSNLEAHHKALEIRRKIAVELLASFAYSEKKLEAAVQKAASFISRCLAYALELDLPWNYGLPFEEYLTELR